MLPGLLPFDEHVQRVRHALHELDDLRVGEVRTRVAVDGDHFVPLTEPGARRFALAADLSGANRRRWLESSACAHRAAASERRVWARHVGLQTGKPAPASFTVNL